jgi:hypothetical protein
MSSPSSGSSGGSANHGSITRLRQRSGSPPGWAKACTSVGLSSMAAPGRTVVAVPLQWCSAVPSMTYTNS